MGICTSVRDSSKKEKEKQKQKQEEHILNEQKKEIENMKTQFEEQIKNIEREIDLKMIEKKKLEKEEKNANKNKIEFLRKEIKLKLEEKTNKQKGMEEFSRLYSQLETQKDRKAISVIYNQVVEVLKQYNVNNEDFIKKKEENEEIIQDQKEFFDNLNDSHHVSNDIEEEMKQLEEDYKEDNLPSANKGNIIFDQKNKEPILAN